MAVPVVVPVVVPVAVPMAVPVSVDPLLGIITQSTTLNMAGRKDAAYRILEAPLSILITLDV